MGEGRRPSARAKLLEDTACRREWRALSERQRWQIDRAVRRGDAVEGADGPRLAVWRARRAGRSASVVSSARRRRALRGMGAAWAAVAVLCWTVAPSSFQTLPIPLGVSWVTSALASGLIPLRRQRNASRAEAANLQVLRAEGQGGVDE